MAIVTLQGSSSICSISSIFFEGLISGRKVFPKLVRCVKSVGHFVGFHDLEQTISVFLIGNRAFWLAKENKRQQSTVKDSIVKDMLWINKVNKIFLIDLFYFVV